MTRTIFDSQTGEATDDIYAALMAAHDGLSEAESHALNARLVLLMANEIADAKRLSAVFAAARSYASGA